MMINTHYIYRASTILDSIISREPLALSYLKANLGGLASFSNHPFRLKGATHWKNYAFTITGRKIASASISAL